MTGLEAFRELREPELRLWAGKRALDLTVVLARVDTCEPQVSVLFAPGYIARRRCALLAARALAEHGHTSILLAHAGHSRGEDIEDISVVTAAVANGEFEAYNVQPDSLALAAHSYGAVRAAKSLARDPHSVKAFIPIAPAGLGGVKPLAAVRSIAQEAAYMRSNQYFGDASDVAFDALGAAFAVKWKLPQLTVQTFMDRIDEEARALYVSGILRTAIMFPGDQLIDPEVSSKSLRSIGNVRLINLEAMFTGHNSLVYHGNAVASLIRDAMKSHRLECAR